MSSASSSPLRDPAAAPNVWLREHVLMACVHRRVRMTDAKQHSGNNYTTSFLDKLTCSGRSCTGLLCSSVGPPGQRPTRTLIARAPVLQAGTTWTLLMTSGSLTTYVKLRDSRQNTCLTPTLIATVATATATATTHVQYRLRLLWLVVRTVHSFTSTYGGSLSSARLAVVGATPSKSNAGFPYLTSNLMLRNRGLPKNVTSTGTEQSHSIAGISPPGPKSSSPSPERGTPSPLTQNSACNSSRWKLHSVAGSGCFLSSPSSWIDDAITYRSMVVAVCDAVVAISVVGERPTHDDHADFTNTRDQAITHNTSIIDAHRGIHCVPAGAHGST